MNTTGTSRKLARPVDIIGVGASDFGMVTQTPSMLNLTTRELWAWAAAEAVQDSGIPVSAIDALFVGNMIGEMTEGQYHLGYVLDLWTGLSLGDDAWKPAVRVDGACASSSQAIRQAVFAVASGAHDVVIAGGVELSNAQWNWQAPGDPRKMSNQERVQAVYGHYDQGWEMPNLVMLDHTLSQWLIAYAIRYGLSINDLYNIMDARIMSNIENGLRNPTAFWKRNLMEIATEAGFSDVHSFLRSPEQNPATCWPMRRWDGPRRCDGAAALVICAADLSRHADSRPVHYLGSGNAMQTCAISKDMYTQPFIVEAGKEAFSMAGVSPAEVGVIEMYDYGPAEYIIPLEDLGYFERGQAGQALLNGQTLYSGSKPVNPSGGTTCGVAAGSVGAASLVSVVKQLRGEAGENQVNPVPKIGMVYDCGAGRDAVIHILGR